MPLPNYVPCLSNDSTDRKTLITRYFNQGYTNVEIITFLHIHHNIQVSISTLKRALSTLGLKRRIPGSSECRNEIAEEIRNQLVGSGSVLGKHSNICILNYAKHPKGEVKMSRKTRHVRSR